MLFLSICVRYKKYKKQLHIFLFTNGRIRKKTINVYKIKIRSNLLRRLSRHWPLIYRMHYLFIYLKANRFSMSSRSLMSSSKLLESSATSKSKTLKLNANVFNLIQSNEKIIFIVDILCSPRS